MKPACEEIMGPLVVLFALLVGAISEDSTARERKALPSSEWQPLSVLLVAPPYSGHVIPFLALAEELVGRGHNVTLVSGSTDFVLKQTKRLNVNLWNISTDGFVSPTEVVEKARNVSDKGPIENIQLILGLSVKFQEAVLRTIDNSAVESFDIIAGDASFSTFLMCFSRKWNIPGVNIWVSLMLYPFDMYAWSFPPLSSGYSDDLTFFQRLVSTITWDVMYVIFKNTVPPLLTFAEGLCNQVNLSLDEHHTFFHYYPQIVASSIGFEFPRVLLPLTEYVGPIISQCPTPLPQDLAHWLDQREPGSVLYVSMGSTAILTGEEAKSIVSGAAEANLSVVWSLRKSNQAVLENLVYDYERVLVADWVPQLTLLRHPSIHSALLHGGLGGVQEALSCGIPIIVVPFFADQLDNAVRVQAHHYGTMIHRHQLTPELVSQSLRLFDSQLYQTSLQRIQRIYRNDGGASRAADLLEFYSEVGYQHLVPSYAKYNWSWVQFYNVDVYTLLALAVLLPCYLLYRLIRCCCHQLLGKPKKKIE